MKDISTVWQNCFSSPITKFAPVLLQQWQIGKCVLNVCHLTEALNKVYGIQMRSDIHKLKQFILATFVPLLFKFLLTSKILNIPNGPPEATGANEISLYKVLPQHQMREHLESKVVLVAWFPEHRIIDASKTQGVPSFKAYNSTSKILNCFQWICEAILHNSANDICGICFQKPIHHSLSGNPAYVIFSQEVETLSCKRRKWIQPLKLTSQLDVIHVRNVTSFPQSKSNLSPADVPLSHTSFCSTWKT